MHVKMVLESESKKKRMMKSKVHLIDCLYIKYRRFLSMQLNSYNDHYNGLLHSNLLQSKYHYFSGHLVSMHVSMIVPESDGAKGEVRL